MRRFDRGRGRSDDHGGSVEPIGPGKRTLTAAIQPTGTTGAIQRKAVAGVAASSAVEGATAAADPFDFGFGTPLRADMEASFDADFSSVSVTRDAASAASLNAVAYTQGERIVLGGSAPGLDTDGGRSLLGHELAHVVQQRAGRVEAPAAGPAINADARLEAEADVAGERAARGAPAGVAGAGAAAGAGATVQRHPIQRMLIPGAPGGKDSKELTLEEIEELMAARQLDEYERAALTLRCQTIRKQEGMAARALGVIRALLAHGRPPRGAPEMPAMVGGPPPLANAHHGMDIGDVAAPMGEDARGESAEEHVPVRGTRDVYETPAAYIERTGTTLLYRAVRMIGSAKTRFTGQGDTNGEAPGQVLAPPDGNLFPGVEYPERLARYRGLEAWPADAPITAVDPDAQADPLVQVAGGDRGTQYISTGAEIQGAAHNTVRSWNDSRPAGERTIRRPDWWAPVITIDVRLLGPDCRVYDIQRPGVEYMYRLDPLAMMANLSAGDAEVLLTGTIPAAAIVDIITAPRDLAEAAGVTVDELARKFQRSVLEAHGIVEPEAQPPAEDDDVIERYVPARDRRAAAAAAAIQGDADQEDIGARIAAVRRQQSARRDARRGHHVGGGGRMGGGGMDRDNRMADDGDEL